MPVSQFSLAVGSFICSMIVISCCCFVEMKSYNVKSFLHPNLLTLLSQILYTLSKTALAVSHTITVFVVILSHTEKHNSIIICCANTSLLITKAVFLLPLLSDGCWMMSNLQCTCSVSAGLFVIPHPLSLLHHFHLQRNVSDVDCWVTSFCENYCLCDTLTSCLKYSNKFSGVKQNVLPSFLYT